MSYNYKNLKDVSEKDTEEKEEEEKKIITISADSNDDNAPDFGDSNSQGNNNLSFSLSPPPSLFLTGNDLNYDLQCK